ncbi:MAG: hypothetical protein ACLUQC_11200 [Lactococcus raffinolactis]
MKEEAQKVFDRQGLELATAIKMFITKTAYEQEIPLSVQSSKQSSSYPDDWFTDKVANRKELVSWRLKNHQFKI